MNAALTPHVTNLRLFNNFSERWDTGMKNDDDYVNKKNG